MVPIGAKLLGGVDMSTRMKCRRMQIQIDEFSRNKIERAARYTHKTVSEFVVGAAVSSADNIIEEHEHSTFSHSDWDTFYAAILKPPKPNKALRAAFRRYHRWLV